MTGKLPNLPRGPSRRDRGPERAARHAGRADESASTSEPRRKAPRNAEPMPGHSAEQASHTETASEGKKGPPHRRRERVGTHAPRPVSTVPVAVGGARPTSQSAAQRTASAPGAASGVKEEAAKSSESKVFIYTYTIWNRSTSS
jgi:hypothetical protein